MRSKSMSETNIISACCKNYFPPMESPYLDTNGWVLKGILGVIKLQKLFFLLIMLLIYCWTFQNKNMSLQDKNSAFLTTVFGFPSMRIWFVANKTPHKLHPVFSYVPRQDETSRSSSNKRFSEHWKIMGILPHWMCPQSLAAKLQAILLPWSWASQNERLFTKFTRLCQQTMKEK